MQDRAVRLATALDDERRKPTTRVLCGCTVLRFDEAGLVAEARDYSHVREGHHAPPAGLFNMSRSRA
ncbi:hypothetical protein AB0J14_14275 [Micromonospora arborensis]|uniref:hypothetical protein n=1 Tax=Micromonospora arborensis TaxID=2116518 RepID=UPI0033FFFA25